MRHLAALFCLLAFATPALAAKDSSRGALPEQFSAITVLATSSLSEAMTEISALYSRKKHYSVSASFESSETLTRYIEDGEPADIFISERESDIKRLQQQGLVDVGSITLLAKSGLSLVVSNENLQLRTFSTTGSLQEMIESLSAKTLLITADPDTEPLGNFARQSLKQLGMWGKVSNMMVKAATSTEALYMIAKGEGAGIVFSSDASQNPEIRTLALIPESLHDPIIYQGAVVAGENMQQARAFLEFMKTGEAKAIFKKHGFELL